MHLVFEILSYEYSELWDVTIFLFKASNFTKCFMFFEEKIEKTFFFPTYFTLPFSHVIMVRVRLKCFCIGHRKWAILCNSGNPKSKVFGSFFVKSWNEICFRNKVILYRPCQHIECVDSCIIILWPSYLGCIKPFGGFHFESASWFGKKRNRIFFLISLRSWYISIVKKRFKYWFLNGLYSVIILPFIGIGSWFFL